MPASEETGTAAELLPKRLSLAALRRTAADCRACPLWRDATQIVFGEGRRGSRIILVGEKPGDREDLAGRPFVGPAGRLLDRSLAEAGIDRRDAYVTNVVKHFKFERRGKRRIHKRPTADEIRACRPWLEGELEVVRPEVIVTLGATAAQALLGRGFRLTHHRGEFLDADLGVPVTATIHPSAILRAPDDESRREERAAFVLDLREVARRLDNGTV
jgi:uracil-DNA glycosylase